MNSQASGSVGFHPWSRDEAEVFVPDGSEPRVALARTTHLAIGAHADDLEIMAYAGIAACFRRTDQWFTGVTMTNGAGSVRSGTYANHSDLEMVEVRKREQRAAAQVGEYSAAVQLGHSSRSLLSGENGEVSSDLDALFATMRPDVVYTHNLADKHDTHVAVALRVIAALRRAPVRPHLVIGCEVWRDLDWLDDAAKVLMRTDAHEHLGAALLGIFDSQIAGGKRYDLAARGRQLANATFYESHHTDRAGALSFGMDLTALVLDPTLDPASFVRDHVLRLASDVEAKLKRLR